jgi:hypothetical protein
MTENIITHQQLRDLIARTISGSMPVGILAVTDTRSRKTGNPWRTVFKTVRVVGWVGARYADGVKREGNRQEVDASEFKAGPLPWGQWDVPGKVIEHKGNLYLRTQATPGMRRSRPARILGYHAASGETLSREQVAPFLPVETGSAKQADAGLSSDPREQIWVGTYAFASLRKIRISGRSYSVTH